MEEFRQVNSVMVAIHRSSINYIFLVGGRCNVLGVGSAVASRCAESVDAVKWSNTSNRV